VPSGTYLYASGATEDFSCAAGPAGWRYTSARLDLTLAATGHQLRVAVTSADWQLRGGSTGRTLHWTRGDGPERSAGADGFTGESPGFLVAAARRLGLAAGERARLRLVEVTGPALATRVVEQGWELVGHTPHGPLTVARYRVAALDTGETADVHLTGDVVLAAPGVELAALDSPP
jgi:hypothetical protein